MLEIDAEAVGKALDAIQEPVVAPDLVENPSGHGSVVAIRDGYKLERLPGRTKKARYHTFHDLESFANWLNRHALGNANAVEILAGEQTVVAALNPADVTGDLLTCQLTFHPQFDAWRQVFGKTLSQKDFHSFVRGNKKAFAAVGEAGFTSADVLLTELQKLNVVAGKELNAELDERGFYRFAGANQKANVGGSIPPEFKIVVPVFQGVNDAMKDDGSACLYVIEILLSMNVDSDGGVTFRLDCPSLPLTLHEARLDAVEWLRKLLQEGFLVGLGRIELRDVQLIEK